MATEFSTWTELHAHLLTLYRNHSFGKSSAIIPGGGSVTWSTAAELRDAIDHARTMAGAETGSISFRTYAADGGRG